MVKKLKLKESEELNSGSIKLIKVISAEAYFENLSDRTDIVDEDYLTVLNGKYDRPSDLFIDISKNTPFTSGADVSMWTPTRDNNGVIELRELFNDNFEIVEDERFAKYVGILVIDFQILKYIYPTSTDLKSLGIGY